MHIEKTQKKITELIPDFDIGAFININHEIILGELITALKKIGFPIDSNMVHYWCPDAEMFIYCGTDPLPEDITIPVDDYQDFNEVKYLIDLESTSYYSLSILHFQLKIKCKENPISLIH